MKNSIRIIALSLLILVGLQPQLWSFSFEPISRSFSPAGRGATQTFRLKNDDNNFIAVRIKMLTRSTTPDGEEQNNPADELFTVYPREVVLQPNSNQTVRIKWNGPSDMRKELCYRVLVEQMPVDFQASTNEVSNANEKSSLKIIFRYLGAIYITPEGAAPEVVLERHSIDSDPINGRRLHLTLHNRGTRHTILHNLTLRISSQKDHGSNVHLVESDQLKGVTGENLLPGARRSFVIPVPSTVEGEELQVEFDYDAQL